MVQHGVAVVLIVFVITGCATIMHGTTQDIGISSIPTGAAVAVDDVPHGQTPVIAPLARRDNHTVKVSLAGYQPFEATLTRSASGWVFGNIVFGGLIGLGVDAISGGMYNLAPEQITATLVPRSQPAGPPQPEAAPPLAVPEQVAQPPMPPPSTVPQPVSYQADRQPVAPLSQPQRKARLNVVQIQLHYDIDDSVCLLTMPDTHAPKRGKVYSGVNLKVMEEQEGWLFVETSHGRRGWILREWIQ